MAYPAETTGGETVTIVEKKTVDPANAHASTILVADDGRTFAPAKQGGLIEEITAIIEEGVESVSEAVGDAAEKLVDEVKETVEETVDRVEDALGMGNDEEPAPGLKPEEEPPTAA